MVRTATLYVNNAARGGDSRRAKRRVVQAEATLRDDRETPIDVQLVDLSITGCQVALGGALVVPSMVTIGIAGIGRVRACVVRQDGNRYGCAFIEPLTAAAVAAAGAVETVVRLDAPALPELTGVALAPPRSERLSLRTRVIVIGLFAVATWSAVLGAIFGIRALVR